MTATRSAPGAASHSQTERDGSPIFICLLGEFRVFQAGEPVVLRGGGKSEALLAALALRNGQGAPRESLLVTLWPDAEPELASQSLSTLVYGLRKLLGDAIGGAAPVLQVGGLYRLNAQAGVAVDVWRFETLAALGDQRLRAGEVDLGMAAYGHAVDLYRGDLQAGSDVYALVQRERLRSLNANLLARLADHAFAACDFAGALRQAARLLSTDACREDAHRMAMRCYVRLGERAQALRQYRLCAEILRTEFEAAPEPATTALFDQIRTNPLSV